MPTTMARIRSRFEDLAPGGVAFVTERITATESFHPPAFEDMADADATDSSVAISIGDDPHGIWWYSEHADQWFAGTRLTTSAVREEVGSQESLTLAEVEVPEGMEIDIWQAQIAVVDGDNEDVSMDVYNDDTDTVLYSHDYQEWGAEPNFGTPIGVFGVGGDLLEIRVTNDDPGTLEVSGYLIWSFQTVIE